MSLISKEHLSMVLKSIKKLLSQKVDKSDIVQSDWSQNDETKPEYVKNRTHWEDRKENVEIFNSGLITLDTNDTYYDASQFYKNVDYGSSSIRFINGETYQVNWCGRTDNIIAAYESLSFSNNGWSFYASTINCNIVGPNSGVTTLPFSTTVSIVGPYTELHPVDEKFIPDSIARIDEVNNDIADLAQRAGVVYYGTCSTDASTSTKVVNLQHSGENFRLKTGVIVSVKFAYSNKTTSMSLDVNSTGARRIRRLDDTYIDQNYWKANSYVTFLYEGGYWNIISMAPDEATTSYYGLVRLSDSLSSDSSIGTAATPWAVKQAYSKAAAALPKSGGTMTGSLTLKGNPTSNLHAATKQYVDENTLSIYGGTMKGDLTLKEDPILSKHAATKQYVDKAVAGIDIPEQKQSDWEQNISSAVDYIKNRPFYDGTIYTHTFDGVTERYVLGVDFCEKLYEKREEANYIVNGNEFTYKTDYSNDGQSWSYSVTDGTSEYIVFARASNNNGIDDIQVITMGGSPLPATISFSVENALHKLDDKFIPDSIARVADIPDAVLTPASAQVGQTIIVKSVDENGKPTEWEAVDRTHYDNEQLVGEFTNNDVTFLDEHHTAIYTFTSKLEGLTSNNFEIRFAANTSEPKIIIPAAEMEFIFSEGSSFVAKHENYLGIMHGCREIEDSFEVANETSVVITMEDGLPSSFFVQVYIRDVKQLDEKFIPNSIARKANIPNAPMMVTTQSIDAGSAFQPSATFAEMLEALKNGTTVWVELGGLSNRMWYQVSVFNSYLIQCRENGTRVYQITSTDGLFRNVNG